MRALQIALVAALVLSVLGCYGAPIIPPTGWIYTDIEAPLDPHYSNTPMSGLSKGEATSFSVLGLVAWGDCSMKSAADAGGLSSVEHADYAFNHVLGIYQQFTVKAYGN